MSLTSNDDITADPIPEWLLGTEPDQSAGGLTCDATSCVVLLVDRGEGMEVVFYFYSYSYNRGENISQVIEPIDRMVKVEGEDAGVHFGDHVGDWCVFLSCLQHCFRFFFMFLGDGDQMKQKG